MHFTEEKTEAQRGQVKCHSDSFAELWLHSELKVFKTYTIYIPPACK